MSGGRNCPRGNFPRGQLSGGQLSKGQLSGGQLSSGGNYPGGNCPGTGDKPKGDIMFRQLIKPEIWQKFRHFYGRRHFEFRTENPNGSRSFTLPNPSASSTQQNLKALVLV